MDIPDTVCGLCLGNTKLCRSHIIPDFGYKAVINYESHPRMVVVSDRPGQRTSDTSKQTGYWEYLLCGECERQFSQYETYASEKLKYADLIQPAVKQLITVDGLEYSTLKLYFLSLLWRVGAAKGYFFRCVNLGPHQEKLRLMLVARNPGHPTDYGCVVTPLLQENGIDFSHAVFQPFRTKTEGHNGCLICFGGFAFNFYVSNHALPSVVKRSFLSEGGSIQMAWASVGDFAPLRDLWNRSVQAIRKEADEEVKAE